MSLYRPRVQGQDGGNTEQKGYLQKRIAERLVTIVQSQWSAEYEAAISTLTCMVMEVSKLFFCKQSPYFKWQLWKWQLELTYTRNHLRRYDGSQSKFQNLNAKVNQG